MNYHAVFESKNGHNRIILFEFRIRWGQTSNICEFNDVVMNVLARKEILINKSRD